MEHMLWLQVLLKSIYLNLFYSWFCLILDINESRLEFAEKMGADHILLVKPGQKAKDISIAARAFMEGKGFEKIIECSGAEISIQAGLMVGLICFCSYLIN